MCSYSQHYRNGEPVCDACKQEHSDYARQWRNNGPQQRDGLPELVTDYVATNQPVTIIELQTIVQRDKPTVNAESLRRIAYRLIDRGVLTWISTGLVIDGDHNGYGVLKCNVCDQPYSQHPIGHCPDLQGEPLFLDPAHPRTVARRKVRARSRDKQSIPARGRA